MSAKMTSTYSMWSKFRNCRKACEWRYLKELVPLERDHNLHFGAAIHECLELWHRHRDLDRVIEHIDTLWWVRWRPFGLHLPVVAMGSLPHIYRREGRSPGDPCGVAPFGGSQPLYFSRSVSLGTYLF